VASIGLIFSSIIFLTFSFMAQPAGLIMDNVLLYQTSRIFSI